MYTRKLFNQSFVWLGNASFVSLQREFECEEYVTFRLKTSKSFGVLWLQVIMYIFNIIKSEQIKL